MKKIVNYKGNKYKVDICESWYTKIFVYRIKEISILGKKIEKAILMDTFYSAEFDNYISPDSDDYYITLAKYAVVAALKEKEERIYKNNIWTKQMRSFVDWNGDIQEEQDGNR